MVLPLGPAIKTLPVDGVATPGEHNETCDDTRDEEQAQCEPQVVLFVV